MAFERLARALIACGAAALLLLPLLSPASASEAVTYTRGGSSYEDVRLDLENAIIGEGLKIDFTGNIAGMLERTGKDVGSNVPVYQKAEYFTFCSAKLSRQMMEADPANMSNCPYVVFIYQRAATVKEVSVGYRKLKAEGRGKKALEEINAMLERIAKAAVKN
jgi:uncharacterized protein (DUF302 family)